MMNTLLLTLFSSVIDLLTERGLRALVACAPVDKAIAITDGAFPGLEGVGNALTTWCNSPTCSILFNTITAGTTDMTDEALIQSFLEASGFFHGDSSHQTAAAIIQHFLATLTSELLRSEDGAVLHDRRMSAQHKQLVANVDATHADLNAMASRQQQFQEQVLTTLADIGDGVAQRGPSTERIWHQRIDDANTLCRRGQVHAAQTILHQVREALTANAEVTAGLLFRLATALGNCALELDELETARDEFQAALTYQPHHPVALVNAARMAIHDSQWERALSYSQCALTSEIHDRHSSATAALTYLQALYGAGQQEEMRQFLAQESWVEADPYCALALGGIAYHQSRFTEAEQYCRVALAGDQQENFHAHLLLALAIYTPIQLALEANPPLPWRMDATMRCRLEEAEHAASRAVALLQGHDNAARRMEAYSQRAAIRGTIPGCEQEASRDCDRILLDDPTHVYALWNKGLLQLRLGDPAGAIACFARVTDPAVFARIRPFFAHAYCLIQHYEEAIALLTPAYVPSSSDLAQLELAELLLDAHQHLDHHAAVETLLVEIQRTWPDHPSVQTVVAGHYARSGRESEALTLLHKALEQASGTERDRLLVALGNLYYQQGQFHQAAQHYAEVVDDHPQNPVFVKYVVALYNMGAHTKALTLAQAARGTAPAVPVFSEVESRILEAIGDYAGALALRLHLAAVEPQNPAHPIRAALLAFRQGDEERARTLVADIPHERVHDDVTALMQMAELQQLLGMAGALDLAYQARRLASDHPEIHAAYVRMFVEQRTLDQATLSPDAVTIDCVVDLASGDQQHTITIVDAAISRPELGESSPAEPLARLLMGRRSGERVIVQSAGTSPHEYTITRIRHKYVAAFQDTLGGYALRFPSHYDIQQVRVDPDNPAAFLELVDQRAQHIQHLCRFYWTHPLPLSSVAIVAGCSLIELWGAMTSSDQGLLVCTGTPEEWATAGKSLQVAHQVTLDLVALLTLHQLGLLETLPAQFDAIYVAQPVVDEVAEAMRDARQRIVGSGSLSKQGIRYVYTRYTPEMIESEIAWLERLHHFLTTAVRVVPVHLALTTEEYDQWCRTIGRSTIASILVAKEHACLLWSDDMRVRQYAAQQWGLEGCWSQAGLRYLTGRGCLDAPAAHVAVAQLARMQYQTTQVSVDDLWAMLEIHDFHTAPDVEAMLELLHAPRCTEESAITVAVALLKKIWLKGGLPACRVQLLDLILRAVLQGRDAATLQQIVRAVNQAFTLIPVQAHDLLTQIRHWAQHQVLRL